MPWYSKWLHVISDLLNVSGTLNIVKMFYFISHTVKSIAETSLRLHRHLVPAIGITHKKFEGTISKIDAFIEIFVMRENNVSLIFPPFLPNFLSKLTIKG